MKSKLILPALSLFSLLLFNQCGSNLGSKKDFDIAESNNNNTSTAVSISSISPTTSVIPGTTTIYIYGSTFNSSSTYTLYFYTNLSGTSTSDTYAYASYVSSSTLSIVAPSGLLSNTTYYLALSNGSTQTSRTSSLTLKTSNTSSSTVSISSITTPNSPPTIVPGTTRITITGTNFSSYYTNYVNFYSSASGTTNSDYTSYSATYISGTSISILVPSVLSTSTYYYVSVRNDEYSESSRTAIYTSSSSSTSSITIATITPYIIYPGTTRITISGSNFSSTYINYINFYYTSSSTNSSYDVTNISATYINSSAVSVLVPSSLLTSTTYYVSVSNSLSESSRTSIYTSANTADITTGLVALYQFTSGSLSDESGYANGIISYSATLNTDRNGSSNNAYNFNGTSNYMSIPNASQLNFSTNKIYSISVWIKPTSLSSASQCIISREDISSGSSTNFGYYLSFTNSSLVFYQNSSSGYWGGTFTPASTFSVNNWYHIVVVNNNGSLYYYVNGVNTNSFTPSVTYYYTPNSIFSNTIGALDNGTKSNYFNGSIDNVRIYNRVLTSDDVTQLNTNYK